MITNMLSKYLIIIICNCDLGRITAVKSELSTNLSKI